MPGNGRRKKGRENSCINARCRNAGLKYRERNEEAGCRDDATKMHKERAGFNPAELPRKKKRKRILIAHIWSMLS